ncbi:hypothetical protein FRC08_003916, partial [Ceratobasidium sp. 394]
TAASLAVAIVKIVPATTVAAIAYIPCTNDDFQLNGDFDTESIGMEDVMRGEPEDLPSSNSQWGEEDIAGDMYMNSPMLLDFLIQ